MLQRGSALFPASLDAFRTRSASDMRLELPWPPKELSPNDTSHWAKKARAKKAYGMAAHFSCFAIGNHRPKTQSVKVTLTFCPPNRIRRDLDNMLASMKSALDGISSAIDIDDSLFQIAIGWGEIVKGGAVIVEIADA